MEGDRYCVNAPSVISEVIDGETIVLNFESGHYYSFNPTASEIWTRVCAGSSVAAAAEQVAQRFAVDPATIASEVAAFVGRLEEERLICRVAADAVGAPEAAATACDGTLAAFSSPDFEKFTDMEELLLLDPIHEVADSGWPRKLA
ncbi:MAG TPA: PqqD family protein [Candidatus Binatia bacterium]|nr:PqqD family protein [Candidatus Binatia bacterium]